MALVLRATPTDEVVPLLADPEVARENIEAQHRVALAQLAEAPPVDVGTDAPAWMPSLVAALHTIPGADKVLALLPGALADALGAAGRAEGERVAADAARWAADPSTARGRFIKAQFDCAADILDINSHLPDLLEEAATNIATDTAHAIRVGYAERGVAAQARAMLARNAYALTGDPQQLLDPEPPGVRVKLRGVPDWTAVDAEVRASLPPEPAQGRQHADRVSRLASAVALSRRGDGDIAAQAAKLLDEMTPDARAQREAFIEWSRRYAEAMAARLILEVWPDAGGVPDEHAAILRATGPRFPVEAFRDAFGGEQAAAVFDEAVGLARARYGAGKALRSRNSAPGKAARRTPPVAPAPTTPSAEPGGPAGSAESARA